MSNRVLLATASYDNTINLWDPAHQRAMRSISLPHRAQANQLLFTKDKIHLGVATNPNILFFDSNYQSDHNLPVIKFIGHTANVSSFGLEINNRWLFSASDDKTVKIWDFKGAPGCQRNYKFNCEVNSIVLHPNQVDLICGLQDGSISIINLVADKVIEKLFIPGVSEDHVVRSVSIHPDGSTIASATDSGHVDIWSIKSAPDLVATLQASETYLLKCLFSPNGNYLATTSADSCVKLWNTHNREDKEEKWTVDKVLEGHKEWVWDCCFSADSNYLLTGASDKSALLWEIEVGIAVKKYHGHNNTISAVALTDTIDNAPELFKPKVAEPQVVVQQTTKTGRVIKRAVAPGSPAAAASDQLATSQRKLSAAKLPPNRPKNLTTQ